jgi:hypothetical protein
LRQNRERGAAFARGCLCGSLGLRGGLPLFVTPHLLFVIAVVFFLPCLRFVLCA